jgi:hypothetical protein
MTDSKKENYFELWVAIRNEKDARAEKFSAEQRIKYNDMFDNFTEEVSAMSDWTEASWNEFTAKVDKQWQEFAINGQTGNM